jgi:hypothetical protein
MHFVEKKAFVVTVAICSLMAAAGCYREPFPVDPSIDASILEPDDTGSDTADGGDADSDSDVDTDVDGDTDTDSDVETDTGPEEWVFSDPVECDAPPFEEIEPWSSIPEGCVIVSGEDPWDWSAKHAIGGGYLVWTEWIEECSACAIRLRELETGIVTDVFYFASPRANRVSTNGVYVYFDREPTSYDYLGRELFRFAIEDPVIERLTDNEHSDAYPIGYEGGVTFLVWDEELESNLLVYLDLETEEETVITEEGPTYGSFFDFDGRFIAYGADDSGWPGPVHLFDIENPATPTPLHPGATKQLAPSIVDGLIFAGTYLEDVSDGMDIWIWDIDADSLYGWLDHSPYDQLYPSGSGGVLVYLDTEELEHYWTFGDPSNHVVLYDLEANFERQLTVNPAIHGPPGIWDGYVTYAYGSVTVVCDLEAGGFVDADGGLIPEPDAGPDGGK